MQCLIERWWDTTYTFHITKREMMVTPYDFYHMTGLSFKRAIINLDSVSGIQLGLDMLGTKYSIEIIHYFDLVSDYMLLPQRIMEEHVWMARAFLLHLLGAYLFTNDGKTVSLRWLTLFQDFANAWRANWGQACLAYLYSTLDTLSRGTLRQLVGPWKLLEVSYLSISCIFIYSLLSCKLYHLANCYLANYHHANCTILYLTCGLCFLLQRWIVRYRLITLGADLNLREFPQVRAHLTGLTSEEVSLKVPVFKLLHVFPLGYHSSNLVSLQVNWTPWASQPLLASPNSEAATIIASEITRPFEGAGLRALYLAERVQCHMVGKDDPQISMDPPQFMLAPHSMTNAEYNSWGSGIPYAGRLLDGLDYEEFNITYCLGICSVSSSFFSFFFTFSVVAFVRTYVF